REYVYIPDAMRIVAAVGARAEVFGAHWCLPGSGPLSGREAVDIAARHLGRSVRLRSAGLTTLRILGLLTRDLRRFLPVAPDYMKPVGYDGGTLQVLLGPLQMPAYDAGIGETLSWIESRR